MYKLQKSLFKRLEKKRVEGLVLILASLASWRLNQNLKRQDAKTAKIRKSLYPLPL